MTALPGATPADGREPAAPSDEQVVDLQVTADCLRAARRTIKDLQTSLVAFGDRRYLDGIERDHHRADRCVGWVDQVLANLPSERPLTPEQEAAAAKVIGAVLDKRFGDGTQEAIDAAIEGLLS